MKIVLGTLKDKGEELATFLEPRVGGKASVSGDSMEFEDEGIREGVRPRQVKTYIKRFLYMQGVRKNYRVFVAGKELTIQEIELGEKEKEKEKEKEEASAKKEAKEEKKEEPEEKEAEPEEQEEEPEEKPEEPAEPKPAKKKAPRKPRAKKKTTEES